MRSIWTTILTGLIALLPVMITILILAWLAGQVQGFLGPDSLVGSVFSAIGLAFVGSVLGAYAIGLAVLIAVLWVTGLLVRTRLARWFGGPMQRALKRIPVVGFLYDLINRFVGMFGRGDQADLKSMAPVWCCFGGPGGVAVLALMPTADVVSIEGHPYRIVLVPTSPVPIGGALLYVPEAWVRPAPFGVEALTSIYVSMGVTAGKFSDPVLVTPESVAAFSPRP